jgi:Hinge domain of cleavage stimulation factor subunit 2
MSNALIMPNECNDLALLNELNLIIYHLINLIYSALESNESNHRNTLLIVFYSSPRSVSTLQLHEAWDLLESMKKLVDDDRGRARSLLEAYPQLIGALIEVQVRLT